MTEPQDSRSSSGSDRNELLRLLLVELQKLGRSYLEIFESSSDQGWHTFKADFINEINENISESTTRRDSTSAIHHGITYQRSLRGGLPDEEFDQSGIHISFKSG